MNSKELIEFLIKKSKLKVSRGVIFPNRVTVNRYNSLIRIMDLYNSLDKSKFKYNRTSIINNVNKHYWLDMWASDDLITFKFNFK